MIQPEQARAIISAAKTIYQIGCEIGKKINQSIQDSKEQPIQDSADYTPEKARRTVKKLQSALKQIQKKQKEQ